MAITVLYSVTRASDFKSISISDAGTAWTTGGGELDKSDVTAINLLLFGVDKDTPLKTVTFTSDERTAFLAGTPVVLLFSDARLWGTVYQPDNFIVTQLNLTGGSSVSTQVCYSSWFYLKKIVNEHIADVAIPLQSYYEANRAITGDLAALTTLEYLDSVISIARENKWRKTYDFLQWSYNL